MDEYIKLKPTPFESYLDESMEMVGESYEDLYVDFYETYMEMFNCYMNEWGEYYQEGEIWDQATSKDKDWHPIIKVLAFIPRLLIAFGKSIYNKIHNKKVEKAYAITAAVVENPKAALTELATQPESITDTIASAVDDGKMSDVNDDPYSGINMSPQGRSQSATMSDVTSDPYSGINTSPQGRSTSAAMDALENPNPGKKESRAENKPSGDNSAWLGKTRSQLIGQDAQRPNTTQAVMTKNGSNVKSPNRVTPTEAPFGTYQLAIPQQALVIAINRAYLNDLIRRTKELSEVSKNLYDRLITIVKLAMHNLKIGAREIANKIGVSFPMKFTPGKLVGSGSSEDITKVGDTLLDLQNTLKTTVKNIKVAEKKFKNTKNINVGNFEINQENAKHIVQHIIVPFFSAFTSYSTKVSDGVSNALEEFAGKMKSNAREIGKSQSRDAFAERKAIAAERKAKKKAELGTNPNSTGSKNYEAGLLGKKKSNNKGKYNGGKGKWHQHSYYDEDEFDDNVEPVVEYMI